MFLFFSSSLISHILWAPVSFLLFSLFFIGWWNFIKVFANRVTIEMSKYYAELLVLSYILVTERNRSMFEREQKRMALRSILIRIPIDSAVSTEFYRTGERIITPRIVPIIIVQSQPLVALSILSTTRLLLHFLPSEQCWTQRYQRQ